MSKTIFRRIIDREIPAKIVYEDEQCLAFEDINPQPPVHVLVIPKQEVESIATLEEGDAALAGHLLLVVKKLAAKYGLTSGYRVVANWLMPAKRCRIFISTCLAAVRSAGHRDDEEAGLTN